MKLNNPLLIAIVSIFAIVMLAVFAGLLFAGDGFSGYGSVAVIPVKGDISNSQAIPGAFTAQEIVENLDDAENDPAVVAIFLDIDSGGGDVVATNQIVYKVKEMEKPVLAYLGTVGASGAYYIAAAGDYIVSDQDTITGSIGVISMIPNMEGLMEKLGIEIEVIERQAPKSMGSPFEPLSEGERAIMEQIVDDAYKAFKSNIAEMRGGRLNTSKFAEMADGRLISGRQAISIGLVDELGSREYAMRKAGELGGLNGKPAVKQYEKKQSDLLSLLGAAGFNFGMGFRQAAQTTTSLKAY